VKKIVILFAVLLGFVSPGKSDLITFEDLSPGPSFLEVFNGYHGLQWSNFYVVDAMSEPEDSGYRTGMVSPTNVVFDANADPATLSVASGVFDLNSGYLTAVSFSPLLLEAIGYRNGQAIYDDVYRLDTTGPLLANFNFLGIDRVTFTPYTEGGPSQFVVDNLTVSVPEPGGAALLAAGAAMFGLRRLRARRQR
jgi:hypothetical protein